MEKMLAMIASYIPKNPIIRSFLMIGLVNFSLSLFDFNDPMQLMVLQGAFVLAHMMFYGVLAYYYVCAKRAPEANRVLVVKPSQMRPPEMLDETDPATEGVIRISQTDYEHQLLFELAKKISITAFIVASIHLYAGYTVPLFMSIFMQGRTLQSTQFYRLYIKGEDPVLFRELRRPWPRGEVTGWQKSMKTYLSKSYQSMQQELDGNTKPAATATKKSKKKRR